jgi:diacylglycerol O-acyltransferase
MALRNDVIASDPFGRHAEWRRLSGEGAGFLSLELPAQPMNIVSLFLLRPGAATDGTVRPLDLAYLRRHIAARLGMLPVLRWRVVPVPLGLSHPVFVDDPDFDLDFHLRQHVLDAPGGDGELDAYCATVAEEPLDRGHPLWQLILVGGLAGGRQAIVAKIHHCLMDGFATIATFSCILSGEDFEPVPAATAWHPEPAPRPFRLIGDALRDQARTTRRLPAFVGNARRNLAAANAARSASIAAPPTAADVPATSLNRTFTADRRFARTSLPIAELRFVKDAAGATVNDVALALVASSLRAYLLARGSLPVKPLVATVPVGLEPPGAPSRTFDNRFSALTTSLATDVADPWERLAVIRRVTAEAKRLLSVTGPELLPDWLEFLAPAIADRAVRHHHRNQRRHPEKVDTNVVVSNVRGPGASRRLGSAVVEELYIAGPPNNGVGVNVMLLDYGDRIFVGVLTFADSVDTPGEITDGMHAALVELRQQATVRQAAIRQAM